VIQRIAARQFLCKNNTCRYRYGAMGVAEAAIAVWSRGAIGAA
jgi:hypothetical protein